MPNLIEVIRWFINRSGRFLEAYRSGLTGKAAAWAVKKQKQHRAVSERAMVAMENVVEQDLPLGMSQRRQSQDIEEH